ncbi:MAG: hypothetical protein ABSG54_06595 [Terriglobia bacterium]|jgi:hypothetical protein
MLKLKKPLVLLLLLIAAGFPARGDTLYQTNPQGKQVIVHRDAIVVKDDPSFILYKHFELKERRVAKIRLSRGATTYSIATSGPEERQQIVAKWKRFGFTATLVDQAGKSVRVFDLYLDFYPPGGRGSLLESVPARTTLPVLIEGGGADELDFEKLAQIEIQGEKLRVTLRDGKAVTARFLMPTNQPAEARFLGITDQYDPANENVFDFAIPLQQVKEVRFE